MRTDLVDHLQTVFAERARRNAAYSLRSFARSIDIDSSTLSAILRRKRKVSVKTARRLLPKLGIDDPEEARALLLGCIPDAPQWSAPSFHELSTEHAEVISGWEHAAILEATALTDFKPSVRNISRRLGLDETLVRQALGRLLSLRLVTEKNGLFSKTKTNFATPADVPNEKLREGHRQHLTKALDALDRVPVSRRDVSGITVAIQTEKLNEARERIRRFRRELAAFLGEGPCDAVYRLNLQLFPLDEKPAETETAP